MNACNALIGCLKTQVFGRHPLMFIYATRTHRYSLVSKRHRSALSLRSVMPPYIHMESSWTTAECLCLAGGQPWPADSMCHDSDSKQHRRVQTYKGRTHILCLNILFIRSQNRSVYPCILCCWEINILLLHIICLN